MTLINEVSEVVQEMAWMDWQQYLRDRNPEIGQRVKIFSPRTMYSNQNITYKNIIKVSKTQVMVEGGDRYAIGTGEMVGARQTKSDRVGSVKSITAIKVEKPQETNLVDEATEIAENASMGGMSAGGVATTVSPKKKGKKKTTIMRRDSIFI